MSDDAGAALATLLDQLRFLLLEQLDFINPDTRTTLAKVRLLSAAATYFNTLVVGDFGGRIGPARDPHLVEQVVAAAFQTFAGEDPHPGPFDKAAMLLRGITQGHPFTDGNKRTGFLVASYYLEQVGITTPLPLPLRDVVGLCMRVSSGELRDVGEIAQQLAQLWRFDG